jgi:LmbE family N-acetylglucosaminyl deacetylase
MQKIIFGIFAHPDDEAFGPSGTLLLETRAGTELHLMTLTAGENGTNPDRHPDLREVRLEEWRQSGKMLGARSMHYLGFNDGQLNNTDMLAAADEIEDIIRQTLAGRQDVRIEVMTMDLNGISGHIDHIVAARTSCLVFYRLKAADLPMERLRLVCTPHTSLPAPDTSFVFMEAGRQSTEIDETVDARTVIADVTRIMRVHHSQRHDGETHLKRLGDKVAINHFIIRK